MEIRPIIAFDKKKTELNTFFVKPYALDIHSLYRYIKIGAYTVTIVKIEKLL